MEKISLPKKEYQRLRRQAAAYRKLTENIFASVLRDPIKEVREDFRKTGLYTEAFLDDLDQGLRKSSFAK